jgi:glycosyltransferase involved in cell wall biosynthesis
MARIYIDAWCMKSDASGMGRYGHGLIPALAAAAPHHEFIVLRPAHHRHRNSIVDPATAPNLREVFMGRPDADWLTLLVQPLLARIFREHGRPDVYHSLFHLLPAGLRRGRHAPRRIVVTLHDVIWIDQPHESGSSWIAGEWLKRFGGLAIPSALRAADHVICVSQATSERAAAWVPAARRTTIHHGIEREWFVPPASTSQVPPYLAAFGVAKPYKNIRCLVRAFAALQNDWPDLRLVLIGGDGGAADDVRMAGVGGRVLVTGLLADDELRAVMAGAALFVVPSLIEGFGLPALEAMAVGTPLVIADVPALREVAAEAALRFSPAEPEQLARVVDGALRDSALRGALSARGRARAAAHFQWSSAAAQTLAVYDRTLAAR